MPAFCEQITSNHAWDGLVEVLGGSLPEKPEDWVARFYRSGLQFQTAVVPEGRSLERKATSIAQPRSLMALTLPRKVGFKQRQQRVFLAYVPSLEQFQMLLPSNDGTRFSFELIKRRTSGGWQRQSVDQGLCLGCHQSGLAIFPAGPWKETQSNGRLRNEMNFTKHLDPTAYQILVKSMEALSSEGFEGVVMTANENLIEQRVCRYGCEGDEQCMKSMSAAAAANMKFLAQPIGKPVPKELKLTWIKAVSASLQSYAGSILNLRWLYTAEFNFVDHDPREPDPRSAAQLDPLIPRKMKLPIRIDGAPYDQLAHWMLSRAGVCVDPTATGEYDLSDLKHWSRSPDAQLLNQVGTSISEDLDSTRTAEIYQAKCLRCHSGETAAGKLIPKLPFHDAKQMAQYTGDFGRTIESVIRNGSMPPSGSAALTESEKKLVLEELSRR
jgi:hypothetical protein